MARAWRIEYEGACYHLLSRGNERRVIFVGDDDRGLFLDTLIYWVWKSGRFTNAQIGQCFGLTYSAVSHSVQGMKAKLGCNQELRSLLKRINSQYKL